MQYSTVSTLRTFVGVLELNTCDGRGITVLCHKKYVILIIAPPFYIYQFLCFFLYNIFHSGTLLIYCSIKLSYLGIWGLVTNKPTKLAYAHVWFCCVGYWRDYCTLAAWCRTLARHAMKSFREVTCSMLLLTSKF